MSRTEVIQAMLAESTLSVVKDLQLTGNFYLLEPMYGLGPNVDFEAIQPYSIVGNKLTVTQYGPVLKGICTAVPAVPAFLPSVIQMAHEGHQ